MSSTRISALKGGVEVPPSTAHRTSDAADPATGFAAALGAMAASFQAPSHHALHGSDDAPARDDQTDAHAADDAEPTTENTPGKSADASGDAADAAPIATLPSLGGWFAATGNQTAVGAPPPAGQRGPAKPSAAAANAAAATIAASLVTPATSAAVSTAAASPASASPLVRQPVLAAAQLAQSGFEAPVPGGTASLAGAPHAASIGVAPNGDAVAMSAPAVPSIATDAGHQAPAPASSDPSAPTPQVDAAALAAAAPAVAAMINPVAASAGGSGARDFADTARDGQAAAAAFSGVAAASSGTATAGGVGAPSGAAAGPSIGADDGAANVATQLSGHVLRLLANSGHEAVVRLYPPDLGEVTVRVAVSGRDVSAWFGSSQPAVQQSISAGLGQLQTDLGNAGYSLNNAWVGADASGFGARGDTPPPRPIVTTTQSAPVTPVAASPSSNAGVSIYV